MNKRGFLLLEVLLSLGILATSLLAINHSFSSALRANSYAESYTVASLLAQEKMAEIETTSYQTGAFEGDFGKEYPFYRWKSEITFLEDQMVSKVILTVSWKRGNKEYQLNLGTLLPLRFVGENQ